MFRVSLWVAIVLVSSSVGAAASELRPNLQAALEEAKQARQAYADKAALASVALANAPDPRVAINRTRMEIKEAEKLLREQTKNRRRIRANSPEDKLFIHLFRIVDALTLIADTHGRAQPKHRNGPLAPKRELQSNMRTYQDTVQSRSTPFVDNYRRGIEMLTSEWEKTRSTEFYKTEIDGAVVDVLRVGNLQWIYQSPRDAGYVVLPSYKKGFTTGYLDKEMVAADSDAEKEEFKLGVNEALDQTIAQFALGPTDDFAYLPMRIVNLPSGR